MTLDERYTSAELPGLMVVENPILPYLQWLLEGDSARGIGGALYTYLTTAGIVALAVLVLGYLIAAVRHGPLAAGDMTYRVLLAAVRDLFGISPRRVWALARLAVKESLRRRVWASFVVFAVILLFAGWFLDPQSPNPAKLYLSFVLTWTSYLVLLLSLFLSTFSLPTEIKNRIIYTVVTKPVRAGEIVLGRMLGFAIVGSVILALMGLASYVFVVRSLRHSHDVAGAVDAKTGRGVTTEDLDHRHEFVVDPKRSKEELHFTEYASESSHRHSMEVQTDEQGNTTYAIGPREDLEVARVPMMGVLTYYDRDGQPGKGISVGKEWGYRRFVEGNTPAAVKWTFENVTAERFPNGLPVERTIRIFRTHKGIMDRGVRGTMFVKNPDTQTRTIAFPFTAKEFRVDSDFLPRTLEGSGRRQLDLFKDLVTPEGRVEIWLQCNDSGQYFGAAQADLYLRAADAPFAVNFFKGFLGIWYQMLLVIGYGVMLSTFLSGPVAMLTTLGISILGLFSEFIRELTSSVLEPDIKNKLGGGPIEAAIRLGRQSGVMTDLEDSAGIRIAQMADQAMMVLLRGVSRLIPDFSQFDNITWVASGFDVPSDLWMQQGTMVAGYLLAAFFAGFLFMRTREVGK